MREGAAQAAPALPAASSPILGPPIQLTRMTGLKQHWDIERNHFWVLLMCHEPTFMQMHMKLLKKENKSNTLAQISLGEVTNRR